MNRTLALSLPFIGGVFGILLLFSAPPPFGSAIPVMFKALYTLSIGVGAAVLTMLQSKPPEPEPEPQPQNFGNPIPAEDDFPSVQFDKDQAQDGVELVERIHASAGKLGATYSESRYNYPGLKGLVITGKKPEEKAVVEPQSQEPVVTIEPEA